MLSPKSSSQSTTSNSHTFGPIISSTPHPVKLKTNSNPIYFDVRPQRTRTEPKRYGNTIPSDLIPKVQKKYFFYTKLLLKYPKLQTIDIQIKKIFKPKITKIKTIEL